MSIKRFETNDCYILLKIKSRFVIRSQPGSYIPAKAQEILSNLSLGNDVRPPNIYYYLPHLVKNPSGLEPAVRLSQGRTGGNSAMKYLPYQYVFCIL